MGIFSGGSGGSGSGIPVSGWVGVSALTYSSADGPTGVVTTASDLRGIIGVGDRIKLNQTTDKYFIVTAIDATTITMYGGTDYTLANAAIATPFYSHTKSPLGFPTQAAKWTVTATDTSDRQQASPVASTWYNPGSITISAPIGIWDASYEVLLDTQRAANGNVEARVTLSTANNTESDTTWTRMMLATVTMQRVLSAVTKRQPLTAAAKTSYFLNIMTTVAGQANIDMRGDISTTTIRLVSAYL